MTTNNCINILLALTIILRQYIAATAICCLSMPILVCLKGEIMFIFTSGSDKKNMCFNSNSLATAIWRPAKNNYLLSFAQDLYGDVLLLFFQSKTVYFHSKGSLVSNMFSSNTILISMSTNRGQNVKCILHQNIYK